MCGISGIFHFDKNRIVNESVLIKMNNTLIHRGPDESGFYISKNVGLGHRRLSIIDLNTGKQPMIGSDSNLILVFNGEIYNYLELRAELLTKGHSFKTDSDTEVILKAYEEWGIEFQNRLNGMWAFALWDNRAKQLILSRDRIGEKPLFYSMFDNSLIFGSEIKAILSYGVTKVPRIELIQIYLLTTSIPAPNTFYNNIFKLMPGHCIIVDFNGIKEKKYWELPQINEEKMDTDSEKVYEEFESILVDSVKIRMRSDVSYGAFLSGGLDSSSIVSIMSEISNRPINTFNIGYKDKNFDESILASNVAEKFNTNHFINTVSQNSFEDIYRKVLYHFDEPFGDSSAIATDKVSYYASQKVKMVLTGDGGDEVLSGYKGYLGLKFISYYNHAPGIMKMVLPEVFNHISKYAFHSLRYKLNKVENVLRTANLSFLDRFVIKRSYTHFDDILKMTRPIHNVIPVKEYMNNIFEKINFSDDFYKYMYFNFIFDLPNDYLVKVDRMSMANSLETRLPFLDHRLIEMMMKVDKNVKLRGWKTKNVLRKTVGKKLPKAVLKGAKKGFGVPVREWFKENTFTEHLNILNNLEGILDLKVINKIVDENKKGINDNGNFIWTLLVLSGFINK